MHIKRLTACALAALLAISPLNLPSVSADPVSYTHLDVYKRQPCGKSGGPPPKAKYYLVTDSA